MSPVPDPVEPVFVKQWIEALRAQCPTIRSLWSPYPGSTALSDARSPCGASTKPERMEIANAGKFPGLHPSLKARPSRQTKCGNWTACLVAQ